MLKGSRGQGPRVGARPTPKYDWVANINNVDWNELSITHIESLNPDLLPIITPLRPDAPP